SAYRDLSFRGFLLRSIGRKLCARLRQLDDREEAACAGRRCRHQPARLSLLAAKPVPWQDLGSRQEAAVKAMVLSSVAEALGLEERALPQPGPGEIRVKVEACGVCRTDLHVVDGELPDPHLPIVPGHEIVGIVDALATGVSSLRLGQRVGVPWLGHT